jgi:hypothetical protein
MIPLSSRRTLIKGLPVSLAALAATSPFWDRLIRSASAQSANQKRFLIFYIPDGLVPEWFWHDVAGPLTIRTDRAQDSELGSTTFSNDIAKTHWPTFVLQPLAPYAKQMLLVKGLNNAGTSDHVQSLQSVFTGEEVKTSGEAGGPSIDVIVSETTKTANHVVPVFRTGVYVKQTKLSNCGACFRARNSSTFIEPSSSITTDARVLLDSVSATTAPASSGSTTATGPSAAELKSKSRIAILGAVNSRIDALKCAAGNQAGQRLEAYIADLQRVETLEAQVRTASTTPFTLSPTLDPNSSTMKSYEGDIHHLPDVAPFLRELAVSALALDYAPVVTIQWGATGVNKISGNTLTDYRYDFLTSFENKGAGEHGLAHPEATAFANTGHNITATGSTRDRVRVRRWLFNQLKLILDRLQEVKDGTGSLLDNTTVLYASEFGGPNANSSFPQHSNRNLPYMLVGGNNSPFNLGNGMIVNGHSHGDFLYTLAQGMGSPTTAVGKGKTTIDGVLKKA